MPSSTPTGPVLIESPELVAGQWRGSPTSSPMSQLVPKSWQGLPPNQPFFRCITDDSSPSPSSLLTFQMPASLAVLPAEL